MRAKSRQACGTQSRPDSAQRGHGLGIVRVFDLSPRRVEAADMPFVVVNMSMTADGKIATGNRRVSSFGSPRDQEHLLELRATADAVMCGARTVDLNEIDMGPGPVKYRRRRLRAGLAEYNLRVVVSGSGSVNTGARLFKERSSPTIVLTTERATGRRLARLAAAADQVCVCGREEISFRRALVWLRAEWGVKRLLCEGGGELNAALFLAGLVNELHLTICPLIIGGRQAPTIADGVGVAGLADAVRLSLLSQRRIGEEIFQVWCL